MKHEMLILLLSGLATVTLAGPLEKVQCPPEAFGEVAQMLEMPWDRKSVSVGNELSALSQARDDGESVRL